jgi:ATP-dependent helicase HrpB
MPQAVKSGRIIPDVPINDILPQILHSLADQPNLVIEAAPGSGKTTRLPLALLEANWAKDGRFLMLEPRRLAVRHAARYMAGLHGEKVGETIGYTIRLERKVSRHTRLEVITEAILTRRLQQDPSLEGVAGIIFDEFHERSLESDLGLVLALESQAALREDLRLIVMSATLGQDGQRLSHLLGGAPILRQEVAPYPLTTHYLGDGERGERLVERVVRAVNLALSQETRDILVFLPGSGEIRAVAARLATLRADSLLISQNTPTRPNPVILPLYGELAFAEQQRALIPLDGQRRVILATNIAQTSLTIDGVGVVIDSGLMRRLYFDVATGMNRLLTQKISKASAIQRSGRAARQGPGTCYRLWSQASERAFAAQEPPEILHADLTPLALQLALWGVAEPQALAWLDPPPPTAFGKARALLRLMGGLDEAARITEHGRLMADFPLHPRLAHMLLTAKIIAHTQPVGIDMPALLPHLGCYLAAWLSEGGGRRQPPTGKPSGELSGAYQPYQPLKSPPDHAIDLKEALGGCFGQDSRGQDRGRQALLSTLAHSFADVLKIGSLIPFHHAQDAPLGVLVALAYPERLAHQRGERGQYLTRDGQGVHLSPRAPLSQARWLAIANLDGERRSAQIFEATALPIEAVQALYGQEMQWRTEITWQERIDGVGAQRHFCLGAITIDSQPLSLSHLGAEVQHVFCAALRQLGLEVLPWTPGARQLRERVNFIRRLEETRLGSGQGAGASSAQEPPWPWPDFSDSALLTGLEEWLGPFLVGLSRRSQLASLEIEKILLSRLSWQQQQRLESLVPTHIEVPSKSRLPIDYSGPEPVLAVRLQELFGLASTPTIAGGQIPLLLHLLSPARRPVQITRDLASFWRETYHDVKSDLKGQYPKHYWPDNPLEAMPTARLRPKIAEK